MAKRIFERLLQKTGTALRCGESAISYPNLYARSGSACARILELGDPKERTIGILAPSGIEFVATLLGVWRAGAIAVPLQPANPIAELQYILNDSGAKHVFVHEQCRALANQLSEFALWPIESERNEAPAFLADPSHGALMIYTSGTTNRPKGVISTYGSLDAQIGSLLEAWRWTAEDRTLNVLPLHHVHGLVNILACSLAAGAQCELAAKFDPDLVWNRVEAGAINVFMAVPTIYAKLAQGWEEASAALQKTRSEALRRMRLLVSGSAALPAPLSNAWFHISGHRLLERYGMTEIGMALSNPYEGKRMVGTVGIPLPGVSVRLIEGEIQVRGPNLFREYWGKPEATRDSFTTDGWFRTGDIAEMDPEGYYRILGRASQDIIKNGGYKISALEIESALLEHQGVQEAAVIGIEDPTWGERVAAIYTGNADPEELTSFLKGRIAAYKVPTLWKKADFLPRNAMGKVQKPLLRQSFAAPSPESGALKQELCPKIR